MTRINGFIGGAYTLQQVSIDCQRCMNLYPQITESQNQADGEIGALISAPGLRLLGTCGTGPIRGIYVASTGGMAVVSGSEVYRVGLNWTFVKVGDLLTSSGRVSMADNGLQLIIVDGVHGYIVSLSTGTLTQITSASFPGADTVTFQDGYFICNNPGTGQFFWSNLYDGLTYDALNFITAEGSPDATVAVLSNARQLWVFGAKTIEVFWNSGSDSTFSRIDGAYIEYGCSAPSTALRFSNTIMWVGGGPNGAGIVWQAQGYQPKRVSNHGVELAIQGYGDLSSATAWAYQKDGHAFYVLNFPNANTSWVYDISTGQWHERAYLGSDGNFQRHRAECYAFGFNEHCVGDYQNGNIYALDSNTFTDNGNPLVRLRRAPHLSADGRRIFFSKFQLMSQVGVGLDGSPAVGIDPQVELRYSDDFGNTWSTPQARSLGKIGEYAKRVIWRRLGQSRTRVFEVRVSDPVDVTILGAELDATPGVS
jgi:hypothetical protein